MTIMKKNQKRKKIFPQLLRLFCVMSSNRKELMCGIAEKLNQFKNLKPGRRQGIYRA